MHPANNDGNPLPLLNLDDVFDLGASDDKPYKVFIGHNLGYRTFTMNVPMHEFFEISEVANDLEVSPSGVSQRKLDPAHAQKLGIYILKGLVSAAVMRRTIERKPLPQGFLDVQERLGKSPYLSIQPIVVNIRECILGGIGSGGIRGDKLLTSTGELASFKVFLSQRHILWVIDGQHRRKGMEMVFDFLRQVREKKAYPKKSSLYQFVNQMPTAEELQLWEECFSVARAFCTVAVEVHLGLEIDQEKQLFHDLNRLGKKVETSQALNFDSSNPVNLFIKERLIDAIGLKVAEKDIVDWELDDGTISRKDVVAVNARLLLNKTNISNAQPPQVNPKMAFAESFWQAVMSIEGFGEDKAKKNTVAAQPVVLKALAKVCYDLKFSNRRPANGDELAESLLERIQDVDFSHDNPMWRYYEMTPSQRASNGISELARYLPEDDVSVNRDVGGFQGGKMRFGAKHNDIFPLLADMIRWKLGLPNRHQAGNEVEE